MQTNRKFKFLWIRFCDIKENIEILDKFAPLKKKYIRANHSKFVTKELSKTMILRSKLRNQFLKTKSQESKMKYNKQRNLCISMTKTKSSYYENLDLIDITDRVSMKDVCTNLGIFGTPPPPVQICPHLVDHPLPLPTVRVDTMLALFETLQLGNNSHWRVKKLIILFENSIKNIRVKTIIEMMSLHCIPYIPYWIQAEWKF